jgi:hypothetical protein
MLTTRNAEHQTASSPFFIPFRSISEDYDTFAAFLLRTMSFPNQEQLVPPIIDPQEENPSTGRNHDISAAMMPYLLTANAALRERIRALENEISTLQDKTIDLLETNLTLQGRLITNGFRELSMCLRNLMLQAREIPDAHLEQNIQREDQR